MPRTSIARPPTFRAACACIHDAGRDTDLPLAKAVLSIKSNSSKWANEGGGGFAWQRGYGAFSVSASLVPHVIRYKQTQESHHKKMSFEEEFLALLKKHGMDFDPSFVFG
ncbi:MAG TPA: hypothetical protein VJR23_01545 [Candidatus Acidoferrales bacterium]|nr:hypothetical protein [Candidatus Acidoferrales bacterium]